MNKPATKPTTSTSNKIAILEELLMDGAGPIKAYPIPARQKEKSTYVDQLIQINKYNPGIIEDIFAKVQSLHLEALGKSHLQATMETMQKLSDNHPHEYQYALRHIDHNFFFDIDLDDSLAFDVVLTAGDIIG